MYINVKIHKEILLDMFMDRVEYWTKDDTDNTRYNLFRKMYENYIDWGVYAHWCDYFYKLGKRYGLLTEFKENGLI